jgi:hypothetical protein
MSQITPIKANGRVLSRITNWLCASVERERPLGRPETGTLVPFTVLGRCFIHSAKQTMGTTVIPNEILQPLPPVTFENIRSYTELRKLIRVSLRVQNPDWVEPNGDSPLCDSYEARFAELLGL